jgi:hypothetical protein
MKMVSKYASLFFTLAVFSASIAAAENPIVGSWTLDVAKSKYAAEPAPKSGTRTYEETSEGIVLTAITVAMDGKETKRVYKIKEDGKPHPVSDDEFDSLTATRINERETHMVSTKAGRHVATLTRVVSKDGKVLTMHFVGKDSQGSYDETLVYNRD